jgi:hypothetical protein
MRTLATSKRVTSPATRWTAAVCLVCASALLLYATSGSAQQRSAAGPSSVQTDRTAPAAAPALMSLLYTREAVAPSSSEDSAFELKDANVAARFLLEVGALGALGYWGFRTGESRFTQIVLGVGVPLTAAVIWGTFASPQAPVELAPAARLAVQTAIFGASAAALADAGQPRWAAGFAAAVVVNTVLLIVWDQ